MGNGHMGNGHMGNGHMGNGHMGNGICTHMQPGAFIDFAGRVHAPAAAGARRMTRADDTAPATKSKKQQPVIIPVAVLISFVVGPG